MRTIRTATAGSLIAISLFAFGGTSADAEVSLWPEVLPMPTATSAISPPPVSPEPVQSFVNPSPPVIEPTSPAVPTVSPVPTPVPTHHHHIHSPKPTRTVFTPGPPRSVFVDRHGPANIILKPGPTVTVYATPDPDEFTPEQEDFIKDKIETEQTRFGVLGFLTALLMGVIGVAIIYISGYRRGEHEDAKKMRDLLNEG